MTGSELIGTEIQFYLKHDWDKGAIEDDPNFEEYLDGVASFLNYVADRLDQKSLRVSDLRWFPEVPDDERALWTGRQMESHEAIRWYVEGLRHYKWACTLVGDGWWIRADQDSNGAIMLCDAGPRELRLELDGPACMGFDVWPQVSREDEDLHFITGEADDNFWNFCEEILVDVDVVVIEVSHRGYGAFRAWKCPARDLGQVRSQLRPNGLVWVFWADGLPLLSQCPVPVLAFDDILLVREPSLEATLVPNPKHLTSLEGRDAVLAEGDGYVIFTSDFWQNAVLEPDIDGTFYKREWGRF